MLSQQPRLCLLNRRKPATTNSPQQLQRSGRDSSRVALARAQVPADTVGNRHLGVGWADLWGTFFQICLASLCAVPVLRDHDDA